jgi:hypothetical protein
MVCWLRAGVDIIPPTVSTNMSRSVLSTLVRSCGKHHALCVGGSNVSASMRPVAVPLLSSTQQFQQVRFMGKERANKAIKPGESGKVYPRKAWQGRRICARYAEEHSDFIRV